MRENSSEIVRAFNLCKLLQERNYCAIMRFVKIDLLKYANMNICVALSGGRDSMALLHFLLKRGGEYGISVCALNLDHKIRGESSSRDSAFVAGYCKKNDIPLLFFEWTEEGAKTRRGCSSPTFGGRK